MTITEMRSFLLRVQYKRGVKFCIHELSGGSVRILVMAESADLIHPGEKVVVNGARKILFSHLPKVSERSFSKTIYNLIWSLEKHEMHEWLKIDGKHYIHPHPELARYNPNETSV